MASEEIDSAGNLHPSMETSFLPASLNVLIGTVLRGSFALPSRHEAMWAVGKKPVGPLNDHPQNWVQPRLVWE